MKYLLCLAFLAQPFVASAQTVDTYTAFKTMIASTSGRLDAALSGDMMGACTYKSSSGSINTMVYYLAFEVLKNPETVKKLSADLGPLVVKNYSSMFKQNLPMKLHLACISGDLSKIKEVMLDIEGIYYLE